MMRSLAIVNHFEGCMKIVLPDRMPDPYYAFE